MRTNACYATETNPTAPSGPTSAGSAPPGSAPPVIDPTDAADRCRQLAQAVQDGQLRVLFQPIVDLTSLHVRSAEALVRWEHPTRGLLTPEAFLADADEELLTRIGQVVLEQALAAVATWRAAVPQEPVKVAVNVVACELTEHFPDQVAAALARHGLPTSALTVELTESHPVLDVPAAAAVLTRLRQAGVMVALDDFGTGHTNLSMLAALPADELKVDRSFTAAAAAGDVRAQILLESVLSLAGRLGMGSVVEGVEDLASVPALLAAGARCGQGWAFGRPADAEQLSATLRAQHAAQPHLARQVV